MNGFSRSWALAALIGGMVMALPLLASAGTMTAQDMAAALAQRPLCREASHDRLVIRTGRDVCSGTIGNGGRVVAAGYMPTVCADNRASYRIDYKGKADRCLRAPGKQGT